MDQKMIFTEMVHDVLQRLALAEAHAEAVVALLIRWLADHEEGTRMQIDKLLAEYRLHLQGLIEDTVRLVPTAVPVLPPELPEWLWLSPEPEALVSEYLEKIGRTVSRMRRTLKTLEDGLCR
jgi:DNA-binding transcriptional ArsR family regulator